MSDDFAKKARKQLMFWAIVIAILVLFLWLFADILLPFIAGMALAYFLDPVADRLEAWGLSRMAATCIILVLFVVVFLLGLIVVVPILANQIAGFLERLPSLVTSLQALVANAENGWIAKYLGIDDKSLRDNMADLMSQGAGWLSTILQQIWASGKSLVSVVSLLVVTPVVAFYLLYDWDRMVAKVDSWLPRDHHDAIQGIMSDINTAIAGFVRGQGTLCMILGLFYAISLTIAGLNFGLLIGLFAGLISFIPYVGSLVGLLLSVGVALVQFWPDYMQIGIIAFIFGLGQFLEGNILQPKLVGDSVGLHPVWLMFALFAFGSLLGFTGMLIAVPAAAAVAVVVRFALSQYLASEVYRGHYGDGD